MFICKISSFYKIEPKKLIKYPQATLNTMWEAITILEAQEQLKNFSSSDWPNMKKNAREKLHKQLYAKAYPDYMRTKNVISVDDLKRTLGV